MRPFRAFILESPETSMRQLALLTLAAALVATGASAAAPCRDAKGHFIKCAAAAPAKPVKCKDAKGKFAKCDAPGAKPV